MPRLEDAFKELVLTKIGDDIGETTVIPKKSDAITLAILSTNNVY